MELLLLLALGACRRTIVAKSSAVVEKVDVDAEGCCCVVIFLVGVSAGKS